MSKLELDLNVNSFELGALRLKLELNDDKIVHGGINVDKAAPGRVREGDRLG